MKKKVAIIGVTGAVGQEFVQSLNDHPWFEVTQIAASERSAGKKYVDAIRDDSGIIAWDVGGEIPDYIKDMPVLTIDEINVSELDSTIMAVMSSGGSYTAVELVETLGYVYYPSSVKIVVDKYEGRIIYYADKYGVPAEDMVGLITQESGGDPEIGSSTGCWGLGQFCGPTANEYGLCDKVPDSSGGYDYCVYQDDRNDPEKSMDAIARYLKVLLARYSKYDYQHYFAHADYNAGPGIVLDAIEEAKLEYGTDNPTWLQFASMVGPEEVIEHYSWVTDDNEKDLIYSVEKALEVKKHGPRVMAYKQIYEGGSYIG